jgi:hypothetical protein
VIVEGLGFRVWKAFGLGFGGEQAGGCGGAERRGRRGFAVGAGRNDGLLKW